MKEPAEVVKALLTSIAATHERREPPDVDQRTAAWWWGLEDEEISYAHGICDLLSDSPIGQAIYLASVAEDTTSARAIKDWGYRAAVEFAGARGTGQRRRSLVESYRADWGHQAARDGLARAMWPHLTDEMPGRDARCKQYGCGHNAYMRVRDAVENQARQIFDAYKADLFAVVHERWSRDMRDRWQRKTGREYIRA